jgi:hypothetical protein
MVVAIIMGHAAVRKHLHIMVLFDGDLTCRFCGSRLKQCSILFPVARRWFVSTIISLGSCWLNKRYKHSFIKGPLPLYKRRRVIEPELNGVLRVAQ